jgi:hypothetical protein
MSYYHGVTEAVERVVRTAIIDRDAPREPRDERVRYNPADLAKLVSLITRADRLNAAVAACVTESNVHMRLEYLPSPHASIELAFAALRLQERIAPAPRHYREGPNGIERIDDKDNKGDDVA